MIQVYKFGPAFGLPDASPFVTKVETYLRIVGEKYETVTGDVRKAPRSQLPFVKIDDKIIPDSSQIVAYVEGKRAEKLDAWLDPRERAVALAFKTMLEEHFYFAVLYFRWATEDGWAVFRPNLMQALGNYGVPSFLRGMVSNRARAQVVGRAERQGVGRKPREEVAAIAADIIDALSLQLADRPYFCGDRPTTFDATVYAFVGGMLCPAFDNEPHRHAKSKANLVAYHARLREQYWKD